MTERIADHPILPMFTERWSPRAFDARTISEDQLFALFEAARWAPSSMNAQPWRFGYALRGDAHWEDFLSALVPGNQAWAVNAAALIFVISDKDMDYDGETVPNGTHSFDAGAAWMSLALQANAMGLITHGMAGFDDETARRVLNIADNFHVNAAVAIGYQGDKAMLPESYQQYEGPNERRSVRDSVFHGPMTH